ncbi:MFS transporter [Pseudonocardia spinosispora]|uniref:MFS transporter n=1 Tax=Pseudonocardia spinosispora TaxID=103441 RepID=UPI000407E958|nr:MFS transporter [Pseudonocardia spinosispora]
MTYPVTGAGRAAGSASARLDRLPLTTRTHRVWAGLLCAVFLFELADLNTFAYVAPALHAHWGVSVSGIGLITSAAFGGMFIGALTGGRIADRFGRKWTLIGSAAAYSLCSLASAFSPNLTTLGVLRILTGVGLEAMTVVGLIYVAEMFPAARRGRYQSLILGVGLLGIPMMSWFARFVVPTGVDGWRWVFVLGAVGLVAALAMVRLLPESVRWLDAHGRHTEAERVVAGLENEARATTGALLPPPQAPPSTSEPARLRELFVGSLRSRTLLLAAVWIFGILGFYGFNAWVPTLLAAKGYDVVESLTYTAVLSIGAVPGALLAWPFIDRWERKYTILVIEIAVAALVLVYGFVGNVPVILLSGFLVTLLLQMQTAFLYTYTPEVFPTRLRGIGTGFTNGIGRLAGAGGGILVAAVYQGWGYTSVFVYVAVCMVLVGLLLAVFGVRTTGRALETITRPDRTAS